MVTKRKTSRKVVKRGKNKLTKKVEKLKKEIKTSGIKIKKIDDLIMSRIEEIKEDSLKN